MNNVNIDEIYSFYATTAPGLETVAAEELSNYAEITDSGGAIVFFKTKLSECRQIIRKSRVVNKIVWILAESNAGNYDDLYKLSNSIEWDNLFELKNTFKIDATAVATNLNNTVFGALKVKDGIADYFRNKYDSRPDVQKNEPDVYIELRVYKNKAAIGLNLAGQPLFKRGYRTATNVAPLKETLAAGIAAIALKNLRDSKKKKIEDYSKIIDPMCGAGSLIIETAFAVLDIPALRNRQRYGFDKLKFYCDIAETDKAADTDFRALINKQQSVKSKFYGFDRSNNFLNITRKNVDNAKLNGIIKICRQDFFEPSFEMENSILLFNPPFDERLKTGGAAAEFYARIGDALKKNCKNSTAFIFTEFNDNIKRIGLRPSLNHKLYNGRIECRLLKYEIY